MARSYDGNGRLSSVTDFGGRVWSMTYDYLGQLRTVGVCQRGSRSLAGAVLVILPLLLGALAAKFGVGMGGKGNGKGGGKGNGKSPEGGGAPPSGNGRGGDQRRLREIADDPNTSSADRGWIRQELNSIERGQRKRIRRPPGKELAHPRGREAAKGYSHTDGSSRLQNKADHKRQHRHDDNGRSNRERR